METPEIDRLQNEIARLNSIIDALITENSLLKQVIARPEIQKAISQAEIAFPKITNGNIQADIAFPKTTKGNINEEIGLTKITKGNLSEESRFPNFTKGNIQLESALAKNSKGNFSEENPSAKIGTGNIQTENPFTINGIPIAQQQTMLFNYLYTHAGVKVKRMGRRNIAKLLIHFYHKNSGAYPELKKLTGITDYGLAKLLRSLKKRGWIVRSGWQQFALTDAAKKMVEVGCGLT